MVGAMGGFLVGLVPHHDAVNLASLMLALGVAGAVSLLLLPRPEHKAAP